MTKHNNIFSRARHNRSNAARRIGYKRNAQPGQPGQRYAFEFSYYSATDPEDSPHQIKVIEAATLDDAVKLLPPNALRVQFLSRKEVTPT